MGRITDLEHEARPREKLLQQGASALSDEELMAIFLRVGVVGMSAIELAHAVLERFGSLAEVFRATPEALCAVKGMGKAKYVQFQAVLEMARRILKSECRQNSVLDSREAVYDYVRLHMLGETTEIFRALWLDGACRLIAHEILARGTHTHVEVPTRLVVERALFHQAAGVIVVHNHPSGHEKGSQEDKVLTQALHSALSWIEVTLHDHWIVTERGVFPIDRMPSDKSLVKHRKVGL